MVKRTGPTNPELQKLINDVKETAKSSNINLWKRIAYELEKPTRRRRSVNIYRINKHTREGETAIVPGKVLSMGEMTKKLTVAAYQFSREAEEKINKIGKAITIKELIKKNPQGKKIRIIG